MSIAVELTVSLKIPDVTALTARRALQGPMGYGDVLGDLTRADWWRLELDVETEEEALALAHELAEQTNLFVNPNKHVFKVARQAALRVPRDGLTPVGVLTGFKDDAKAALALDALHGRLGYGTRVQAVDLGTLWTFWLKEADPQKAAALAAKMTVTSDRHSGLLANPHSMWWRAL